MDNLCVKHTKELEERQRYNQNEEKKFLAHAKELNIKEFKQYQIELNNEYKRNKEDLKKELSHNHKSLSSKERDERIKLGKEKLHADQKIKADNKRKKQELALTSDLCRLKRKHLVMFHKLEYELLLNEIEEQKAVLLKNHQLLEQHLNSTYQLKQRHIKNLQKSKHEYINSEINEEKTNYQNYSARRRRELKKKHANEIKQHPKNLKQQQLNIRRDYKNQYTVQNREFKLYREKLLNSTPKDQVREKLERIKNEQNRKFSLLYEHYKKNLDSVYQEQNLKLNSGQQAEQDHLNEDLETQMRVLDKSHEQRKRHQEDMFAKEIEHLEAERAQKFRDLRAKMEGECEDFERSSKSRLNKLSEMQRIIIEGFDKECADKYGLQMQQQQSNR